MKYSEMNDREKKAFRNIMYAARNFIGGLENTMMDYNEEDPEYQEAERTLKDHEGLVNEIYHLATNNAYDEGVEYFGPNATRMIKDIRFCGRDWLMERVNNRVINEGY